MPREDYDKFIEIYSREGKYSITSPKAKYPFYYFAKVYNKETIKIEEGISYSKFPALGIDIDIFPLDNYKILVMLITDKGYVEYKNLYLPETDIDEVTKTVNLINKMIIGTPINEISEKLEYDVKPIIGQYVKQHEVLYNAFYDAFSNFTKPFPSMYVLL